MQRRDSKEWGVWLRADDPWRRSGGERGGWFTNEEERGSGKGAMSGGRGNDDHTYKRGSYSRNNWDERDVGSKYSASTNTGGRRRVGENLPPVSKVVAQTINHVQPVDVSRGADRGGGSQIDKLVSTASSEEMDVQVTHDLVGTWGS
jgi:hypothetical protein